MSTLNIELQSTTSPELLIVCGVVDIRTFPMFEAVLYSLSTQGTSPIEIDLRKVTSFNSPAVGALVMLASQRRSHGSKVKLICLDNGSVAPMIQRSRLDGVFSMTIVPAD